MGWMDALKTVGKIGGALLDTAQRRQEDVLRKQGKPVPERKRRATSDHAQTRRSDEQLRRDTTGTDKKARDYSYRTGVSLERAAQSAPNETGVYVLWLNGRAMKCGRAAYGQGVRWRFTQYWNLNYDDKARSGEYWSVSPENRKHVTVSWQCCPVSKCEELEAKLFRKYGKGPWAKRAPGGAGRDSWELLI